MSLGAWIDHRTDPRSWAADLAVEERACEIVLESHLIDLHLDTEVPVRLLGYDPGLRHESWRNGTPFFGQTDYPRLLEGGVTGVVYDIATNPLRCRASRTAQTVKNIRAAVERIERNPELRVVRTLADYQAALRDGKLAFWLAVQGGNAFSRIEDLDQIPGDVVCRVTLVHLTSSELGTTSSPLRVRTRGLTDYGRRYLEALQERRILVDLAHIHPTGFWDAVDCADKEQPLIASHTGVCGVYRHWRNLDDRQLRAIAERNGVVGIIFHSGFLQRGEFRTDARTLVRHIRHVMDVAGEETPALGSDYDGLIIPPRDLPDPTCLPRLVQEMLNAGLDKGQIRKVLGENWLRVLGAVRPG